MAPIHESDVAEKRWHDAEWRNFELWEKIELRIRRARFFWILGTAVLFLFFASIPILMDRGPRWKAMGASRLLAQELNRLKLEAIESGRPTRLRFFDQVGLQFRVEEASLCSDSEDAWRLKREGSLLSSVKESERLRVLSSEVGLQLGVPGLGLSFCYDPLQGADSVSKPGGLSGIGIMPSVDLESGRADRIVILLASDQVGELAFE